MWHTGGGCGSFKVLNLIDGHIIISSFLLQGLCVLPMAAARTLSCIHMQGRDFDDFT